MIKFFDSSGKLVYVLLDNDTEPRPIEDLPEDILKELGIELKEKKIQGESNDQ